MSKEEVHNGKDNNGRIEGGRAEATLQINPSSGEASISNYSEKGDPSIDRDVSDNLSKDQSESDLTQNEGVSSNNREDKADTIENTLTSDCQPGSGESGSGIKDDSDDSNVNKSDPVPDLPLGDKDDKNQNDVKQNDINEDTVGRDSTNVDPESVTASTGVIKQTENSDKEESSQGNTNTRIKESDLENQNLSEDKTVNSQRKKDNNGSVRRESTDSQTKIPENQDEVLVDKIVSETLSEKESSKEVDQDKTNESKDQEEYDDDFEDTGENDTELTENSVQNDKFSDEQPQTQTSEVESEKSNEVLSKAADNQNKPEESVEQEGEYEDDFEATEPKSENNDNITEDAGKSNSVEKERVYEEDCEATETTNENIAENAGNDHSQTKEDLENYVSGVESGETDRATSQSEATKEPEEQTTKVVVDDDGIPKVLVTTVPDRPPSSQGSDTETKENIEEGENERHDANHDIDADVKTINEEKAIDGGDDTEAGNPNLAEENKQDQNIKNFENVQYVTEHSVDKTDSQVDEGNVDKEITDISKSGDIGESKDTTNKPVSERKVSQELNESNLCQDKETNDALTNGKTKYTTDIVTDQTDKVEDTKQDQMEYKTGKSEEHTAATADGANPSDGKAGVNEYVTSDTTKTVEKENEKKANEEKDTKNSEAETKKVESPLDKLLQRHVEIDGTVESITQLEQNVVTLLASMKEVMSHYFERLKLQTLKDITEDMGKFRGDFTSVNEAFKTYSAMTVNINQKLKELRHVTEDVKSQISRKFVSEDLSTWVDETPEQEQEKEKLQDEMFAAEKAAMAKAAEARQAMATATVGVAQANQFVTELEVQTAEAEAIAIKAAAQAKASLVAAEEARKAAEERRLAEEASKRRADERAKAKAEEAKKKKAEEEMVIHMEAAKKGTSVEDEREKFLKEKARKEEERRNPKNWPKYSYNVAGKDFNPGIGCVIRAVDGSLRSRDVDCALVDQSKDVLKLRENEELVSNIIRVTQTEADRKFMFEEPMSIALPVCFNRVMLGREAVVKQLVSSGAWKELPSADVQLEEFRETRFVEGRSRTFGTFAVILRLKKDNVQFAKKVGKVVSSVDSRISFTNQNGTFKQPTNGILEVQSLDVNTIPELKFRAQVECENLLTSSPIIRLTLPTKRLDKSMTVTIPLPSTQSKQTRPSTGLSRPVAASEDARPATARPVANKEEEIPEDIRFLYKDEKTGWTVNKKLQLTQLKNKDIVVFDTVEPYERFVVLRTKPGVKDNAMEKMATLLERSLAQRNVRVSLRQHHHDASEVAIVCTTSIRTNKALKSLEDEGFADGPNPSPDLILQEGQQLYMKFRGNIQCVSENPSFEFIFNSHIRATRKFQVTEIDVFAQKSIHCYRGFVQVFTKALTPKPLSEGTQKAPGAHPEMVESEILLTELLVELPKPEAEPPKPLRTAPVALNDSPLTHLVFRHLATELGKEWRDLGTHLNLKPTRIQAILRQNVNQDTPQTRYDMLVTWAKRIPKGVDKTQILCSALSACGRPDLAEEVRFKGDEFRQQRLSRARTSHLKQAFVKVAKCQAVFRHWQTFAKRLGVPEEEIKRIDESEGSGQEKCYSSLEKWGQTAGDKASIPELSTQLKQVKQPSLSREVESIMVT